MQSSVRFFDHWKSDLPAALVVFLVALPLCLGIALASGAPLVSGIIAGVVGGVVVGSLSGSSLGVSGPAAGLAVIVLTAIQDLGSFDVFLVAVILAGFIQLGLGFAKAGVIAYYFPSSVITGMLSGIGIVIFVKQIPHALGYDADPEGDFSFQQMDGETTISEIFTAVDVVSAGPLMIAAVSLGILILWETGWIKERKALALLPGPLVAVVVGVVLGLVFGLTDQLALTAEQLVKIPVADGLAGLGDMLTFPDFSALGSAAIYKTAIVMAVVASLETLLCVEATDKLDPKKRLTPTNRELQAQGVGNIVSGFLGGLPITQVIVRSSANIQAGGESKASAVLHGLFLLTAVILLPGIMNLIPLATLAAILLIVGYKLAKPSLFMRLFSEGPIQFVPFIATVFGIVFIDLLAGVGIGLAAAVIAILLDNFRIPLQLTQQRAEDGETLRIVLAQQVTFLHKATVLQSLNDIPSNTKVEIDASGSIYVHADVVEIIDNFVIAAKDKNIEVVIQGLEHHQKGRPQGALAVSVTHANNPELVEEQE